MHGNLIIIIQKKKKNPYFCQLISYNFYKNLYNSAYSNNFVHESFLIDFILYSIGMSQGNIANSKEYQNVEETTLNI